jgi:putative nucleotidyltransferase with HDIG domain
MVLNGMTMYRYHQSYRYSRFPLQAAIVYSCCWMINAQLIMVLGETWLLSWWLYHFLLLASMMVMLYGLFKQYAANQSMTLVIRSLFTNDPVERITSCLSPSVKELVLATEIKDMYTAGHNFRVTMYALRLAEEMLLKPEQLRALSQGAIVHDVGKNTIPDAILNKPGRLTTEERIIIETHPVKGYEMCRNLGFMKEELDIIRSHHEKWDGTGYPDRLQGEEIPLLARIVAVADVYDALTSTRSYRKAWSHEEAISFLKEHSGSHFDPLCVQAWVNVSNRDPEVYRLPSSLTSPLSTSVPSSHKGAF